METTPRKLADSLGGSLMGPGNGIIKGVSGTDLADRNDVTFVVEQKHVKKLRACEAGAVIVEHPVEGLDLPQIVVKDAHKALIHVLGFFAPVYPPAPEGVDSLARVKKNVFLGKGVSVGPYVVLEEGCEVGDHTVIGAGCRLGRNVKIGDHARLDCNVVVYRDCRIGNHVVIQSNVVIGSTGFGYYFVEGAHQLIPHIGTVIIDDFVEIGANCCVDRAKFDATRIGAGSKIDNLVQIGHNVIIGRCCVIAGMVGISGSCRLGDGVVIGGKVGLRDHMTIGAGSMVGGGAMVWEDVPPGKKVFGYPARDQRTTLRLFSLIEHLPELYSRVRHTENAMQKLKETALL